MKKLLRAHAAVLLAVLLTLPVIDCGGGTGGPPGGNVPAGVAPVADYGDAPDGAPTGYPDAYGYAQTGMFPTLFASDGARVLDTSQVTLGVTASVEEDANDAADPDGAPNLTNRDSDDCVHDFVLVLNGIPVSASLAFWINAPAASAGGTYYLNVLIDFNMSGTWGGFGALGEEEWAIQNEPVVVTPGLTEAHTAPAFAYGNGELLPDGTWMRIALTRERVSGTTWDGTGQFTAGEVEDHVLNVPPVPMCAPWCSIVRGIFTPARVPIPFGCDISNIGGAAGNCEGIIKRAMITGTGVVVTGADVNLATPELEQGCVLVPSGGRSPLYPFTANRVGGSMPVTYYWRTPYDPAALITPEGVTLGFTPGAFEIVFEQEGVPQILVDGDAEFAQYDHTYTEGTSPCVEEIATFRVENGGAGTLAWELDALSILPDWLRMEPTSGVAPTDVTLTFDCAGRFGLGGLVNLGLAGTDVDTGAPAENAPVVQATWTLETP